MNALHSFCCATLGALAFAACATSDGPLAARGAATTTTSSSSPAAAAKSGTLLLIGGGLDDDNEPVFTRFLELARGRNGAQQIVIVTAASGDEEEMATGKIAALRAWAPGIRCVVVRRETSAEDTIAAIDAATALFFTGGDQKRIVERYRKDDVDSPEWLAMQRLLQRGGVIAGSSAGLAMMGTTMLLGGTSAEALGAGQPANVRIGPGMHFLPQVITDSHFFERDRLGRLAAALTRTGEPLGLAVGEDGCVEFDLAKGTATGIAVSEALVVDVRGATRDGTSVRGGRAVRVPRGVTVNLHELAARAPTAVPARPKEAALVEPYVEEGQNRQLASWRLFVRAGHEGCWMLERDGWRIVTWPAGGGAIAFDVEVAASTTR